MATRHVTAWWDGGGKQELPGLRVDVAGDYDGPRLSRTLSTPPEISAARR